MSTIKLLNTDLINKIAAGEVVERPVSIVKELVENSIDAGSTAVTVEIKDGGISLIQVSDNGIGIDKSEVKTAFLKHATSKIQTIDDLEGVMTLGFRGEALSSIASVAQVELLTKTKTSETGICIEINGGEYVAERNIAAANGTTVAVRNLFYNIPARRKFLKKPSTESGYISDVITKLALGNPHISFRYINNGSELIKTKGNNDLKSTIYQIYGKEISVSLLPVDYVKDEIHVSGYVCKPEMYRSNRSYEHMFINGRHIKSEIISSSVEQSLKTMLPVGKFPIFYLFIKIDPALIDINVHPSKLEVRFWNDNKVFEIVSSAIKKAVEGHALIPEASWQKERFFAKDLENESSKAYVRVSEAIETASVKSNVSKYADLISSVYGSSSKPDDTTNFAESKSTDKSKQIFEQPYKEIYEEQVGGLVESDTCRGEMCSPTGADISLPNQSSSVSSVSNENSKPEFFANYKIVGQLFDTYWIIEQESKLYVMDQHAAHERCLYEQISKKLRENTEVLSQPVLNPTVLNVTPKEMAIINDNMELFERFGFDIDKFGEKEIAIRAVPYVLKNITDVNFFLEITDKLSKVETSVSNIYEVKAGTIASIACKSAVKGNYKLSYEEAKELIEKVLKLENPFTCPHGRPTIIEMSKYELEKRFKRIM